MKQVQQNYFIDNDVVYLAEDLLGKILQTEIDGIICSGIITETEAYRAPDDKASHAYGNRRTKRTETLFGPAGHAYIYLNYGIHHLFNIVCAAESLAHAVLIRAIYPYKNVTIQLERRKRNHAIAPYKGIFDGPGKLSQALGINTALNGINICRNESPIRILESNFKIKDDYKSSTPRIGIDYAEEWIDKPWRFLLKEPDLLFG
jgi:DNA-3-methyladenine glycosylase